MTEDRTARRRSGWRHRGSGLLSRRPLSLRRPSGLLLAVGGLIAIAALSMGAALEVTPMQTVTVAGQVISLGAGPALSPSGPGQVDLFGQTLPTAISVPGPVRPRLELTQITLNSELANFVEGSSPSQAEVTLRSELISGWERYFSWEAAAAGLAALIMAGAVAGWRRLPAKATVRLLAAALAAAEVVNLGSVALAADGAQHALAHVHSLNQLVASAPIRSGQDSRTRPLLTGIQEVVMGDSTAAGAGLPQAADPTGVDRACGRSSQSYAADLAAANGWKVVNLACDSATVRQGLLGTQQQEGLLIPAQIDAASRVKDASVVIVSVGADDLGWSEMLEFCAAASDCASKASAAYFQQKLAAFSADYLQLLIRLGSLSGHPRIVINRYYDPFGTDIGCITGTGLTAAKVRTLSTWLSALNQVLAEGAGQFGYLSPQPSFTGHQLCSPQPYVQGLTARAPFHPTALGQMAIALADQAALARRAATPSVSPRVAGTPPASALKLRPASR